MDEVLLRFFDSPIPAGPGKGVAFHRVRWRRFFLQYKSNTVRRKTTESPDLTGIHWDEGRIAWRARITQSHKSVHVGYFETVEEAIAARDEFYETVKEASDALRDPSLSGDGLGNGSKHPLAEVQYQKLQAQTDREV